MKLSNLVMILVIIQLAVILADIVYTPTGASAYTVSAYNETNTIWSFIADPTGWTASDFLSVLLVIGGGAAVISIGIYLTTGSDSILFSPAVLIFIGFGMVPIISLYHVFTRNIVLFGCTELPCIWATFSWILIGGLLAIFYIIAVLEWWSGRSMSSG